VLANLGTQLDLMMNLNEEDQKALCTTNVVITADHGFATVSKESATSPAAKVSYPDVVPGFLRAVFWPSNARHTR